MRFWIQLTSQAANWKRGCYSDDSWPIEASTNGARLERSAFWRYRPMMHIHSSELRAPDRVGSRKIFCYLRRIFYVVTSKAQVATGNQGAVQSKHKRRGSPMPWRDLPFPPFIFVRYEPRHLSWKPTVHQGTRHDLLCCRSTILCW